MIAANNREFLNFEDRSLTWKDLSRENGLEVMNCLPIVAETNLERAAVSLSGLSVLTITSLSISGMRFQSPAILSSEEHLRLVGRKLVSQVNQNNQVYVEEGKMYDATILPPL